MNGEIVKGEILKIENDTINLIVDELAPKDIIEARKNVRVLVTIYIFNTKLINIYKSN